MVSACVYVHVYVSTHRRQKRALHPLELLGITGSSELRSKHWSSLEEQQVFFPSKPSSRPQGRLLLTVCSPYLAWSVEVLSSSWFYFGLDESLY